MTNKNPPKRKRAVALRPSLSSSRRKGNPGSGNGASLAATAPAAAPPPDSARLLHVLTSNSWDRVAILDRDGIIRYSSPSSQRIYQYSAG